MQPQYYSRDQFQKILDSRPSNLQGSIGGQKVIDTFIKNGATIEGINDQQTKPQETQQPGFLDRLKADLGTRVDNSKDIINNPDLNFVQRGLQGTNQVLGGVNDVINEGVKSVDNTLTGGKVLPAIGNAIAPVVQPIMGAVDKVAPEGSLQRDVLNVGANAVGVAGALEGVGAVKDLAGTGVKAATTGLKSATEGVGNVVKDATSAVTPDSASIMQRVARISKGKQADFKDLAGESVGEYLVNRGIIGTQEEVANKLADTFKASKQLADDSLAKLPGKFQPEPVKTALDELLQKKLRVSVKGATDPELAKVKELVGKYENGGLTMSEINDAKRLYERNVKLDFVKEINTEGITKSNNVDDAIRNWQFTQADRLGLKNLPQINKETQLSKNLLNSIGDEAAGIAGNNGISLTDWIVLADGGASNVAAFLVKKGLSSQKAQSFIAKMFAPKVTKGIKSAVTTEPQINAEVQSYKDFLKATGGLEKKPKPQQLKKQSGLVSSNSDIPQTSKKASGKLKVMQESAGKTTIPKFKKGGLYNESEKPKFYTKYVEPQLKKIGKPAADEITIYSSGKPTKGEYVNTDIKQIFDYPVNEDFVVMNVKKNKLSLTESKAKDKIGYRILN